MKRYQLGQDTVAEATNVSQKTISNFLRGTRTRQDTVSSIKKYLKTAQNEFNEKITQLTILGRDDLLFCPDCNGSLVGLPAKAKYCPYCQHSLSRACVCGTPIDQQDQNFCKRCGRNLNSRLTMDYPLLRHAREKDRLRLLGAFSEFLEVYLKEEEYQEREAK
ncbi:MAG: hypothetical protein HYV27_23335 [Candidatus Hydrogenedentes bacterium]|nr:hypothetical protein [Candidatus Hydrogenedentota bacterium]